MLTLQNTLKYEGDPGRIPLKDIVLSFAMPSYEYAIAPASHDAWVDRIALAPATCNVTRELTASDYRAAFPATTVTGTDETTVAHFWRYLGEALAGGTADGHVPGQPAPLDQLTIPIAVRHLTPDGNVLGQQQWNALLSVGLAAGAAHPLASAALAGGAAPAPGAAVGMSGDSLVLIDKEAYLALLKELGGTARAGDDVYLLAIVGYLCDTSGSTPALTQKPDPEREKLLLARLRERGIGDPAGALALIRKRFAGLFDFAVRVAPIAILDVAGTLRILAADQAVTRADFDYYAVAVETTQAKGAAQVAAERHVDWHKSTGDVDGNALPFSLAGQAPLYLAALDATVNVRVKGFDGAVLWSQQFDAGDQALAALAIDVPLQRPIRLSAADKLGKQGPGKKLRGQVLAPDKSSPVGDLTVLVQARKDGDPAWRIVSAGTTDKSGNFSLAYPYGLYVAAQALLSVAPNDPANIAIVADDGSGVTVADDFLYLLLKDVPAPAGNQDTDDCDCEHPKKAPRLPDQEDLIGSDEYSQDIGGSCVNLSTPNRTLSEHSYKAIVRTSDPDVANYTLKKIETWVPKLGQKMTTFELTGGTAKISRKAIDLSNPVRWQDAPDDQANLSLYQAVTIATGHVLHYKSVFKADGYSLGDLLYSLALAPGQKKEIVVLDASHSLQAQESQQVSQRENLSALIVDDRAILDQLGGSLNESMRGSSSAHTSGVSAGFGAGALVGPVGAALGVSGGTANSSSSAQQNSSRGVSQFFSEKLRQSIMQTASSYRQQNGAVVTTVSEGQRYAATTEVVANHNHCHALTMMYFEVLRHYAIYQELSNVEECVFVPLLMTDFSAENIFKWRDVLAAHLLAMPSETYLRHRGFGYQHPLLKGFDANERIKTNYANVDFPAGSYDEESITFVRGEIQLKTNLHRPRTRYDRIQSLPVVTAKVSHEEAKGLSTAEVIGAVFTGFASLFGHSDSKTVTEEIQVRAKIFDLFMQIDDNFQVVPPARCIRVKNFRPTSVTIGAVTVPVTFADFFENDVKDKKMWTIYATLLGYKDVIDMMENFFQGRLIAEWDDIYYNEMAPIIFDRMVDTLRIDALDLDFSSATRYKGGERIMRVNLRGTSSNRRIDLPQYLNIKFDSDLVNGLRDLVTVATGKVAIYYDTAHYHGTLYSGYVSDDLLDGTELHIPENSDEKRNPRKEDIYVVNKLISHLNSNLEHYNKALWFSLDPDRRYMLLDGFHIQVFNAAGAPVALRSLASVVKNELVTITGNAMVFPVAAGYKVSQSYITETAEDGAQEDVALMDHYQPLTPVPPYRISVPSRGVFAEAVQGSCNACEKVETDRLQDWKRFPNTDEPTAFMPVNVPTPTVTDWQAVFKDFAAPLVGILAAPAAPAPGAGLAGLSALLGKGDSFRDITGLEGNQKNVMATYLSNQENAKAFAQMAKDMAMQAHSTQNSDKIMDSLKAAKTSGALSQDDYAKLVKEHLQQQIDGGAATKKKEADEAKAKPTLTDAAVKAAEQGKDVKAHKVDGEGGSESVDISGTGTKMVLATFPGVVPKMKQDGINLCWATVATMMLSWQRGKALLVQDAMAEAGNLYMQKYIDNQLLKSGEKAAFLDKVRMTGEPTANYPLRQYIDWLNAYGPLWVTTDSGISSVEFSPHARLLTKIVGNADADPASALLTFIDPMTGNEVTETFRHFIGVFEQMVVENKDDGLYIQVVHFQQPLQHQSDNTAP
ncbi:papain-like cysteine protease family protein [Pseudoduganella chitinolytica]|uniref:Papain-like cysteine protease family protein n=1 Tax=Pseudoduganella chitinolytica TaxID=34070 RepID=A0ABY8BB24_9BURK|nr:papain-like cysteine protease family protein [Pseudoduganella chitinolytica]WEF33117.1 papain-like cysteine protease family protein [Pseudoduganella chitinolytica]